MIYPQLPPIMIHSLTLAPMISIVAAFAMPLIGLLIKNRRVWDAYVFTITTIVLALTGIGAYMLYYIVEKPFVYMLGGWPPPIGIVYEVDKFSALLGFISAFIIWLAVIYGLKYFEPKEDGLEWYYTFLLGFEAGVLGCLYTGDIFNVFVLFEVLSVSSYGLISFWNRRGECLEAALKYAIIGSMATTIYFIGVTFAYGSFGTLNMADLAAKLQNILFPVTMSPVGSVALGVSLFVALALWAFTVEAGVAPNHFRVIDAYQVAPSTTAALLSGLASNVGLYLLARYLITILRQAREVAPIVDIALTILAIMGIISILLGSFLMIAQNDINRVLAYSSVLNYGYVAFAIGLGTPLALAAALYHMVNHAIAKTLMFFSSGVYVKAAGTRNLDEMAGVGRLAPITSATMIIGALALAGIPPFNGFVSKLLLYNALLELNLAPLVIVIIISSALSLMGYFKIIFNVYGKPPLRDYGKVEPEAPMLITLVILALLCIVFGVGAPWIYPSIIEPAIGDITNTKAFIDAAYEFAKLLLKVGVEI